MHMTRVSQAKSPKASDVIDAVHLNNPTRLSTPHLQHGLLFFESCRRCRCCSTQISNSRSSQQCHSSSSRASCSAPGTTCSGAVCETATAVQRDQARRSAQLSREVLINFLLDIGGVVDMDARDPAFASRLSSLGAVQPNPHYSPTSRSQFDPQP